MSQDLRARLNEVADHAPRPTSLPLRSMRRVHLREARNVAVLAALIVLATVGVAGGIRSVRGSDRLPANPPSPPTVPQATTGTITVEADSGIVDADATGDVTSFPAPLPRHGIAVAWSPDGTRLLLTVWHSARGQLLVGLLAAGIDGHRTWLLRDGIGVWSASWSPDGTRVAFPIQIGNDWEIRTVSADGSGETTSLLHAGSTSSLGSVVWSPDGSTIAYSQDGRLWAMNADGSDPHAVIPGSPLRIDTIGGVGVAWSPDSARLVIAAFARGGRTHLFVVRADGTDLHEVTRTVATEMTGPFAPMWTADGKHIWFVRDDGITDTGPTLHVMDPDGGHVRDLGVSTSKYSMVLWHPTPAAQR